MGKAVGKKHMIIVAVLVCGAGLAILNQTTISPILPAIMQEMSVSSATAQWLVSGYALVMALVVPISAYLMNRFSTRRIFFFSVVAFIVGSILCALAPTFAVLMAGRCLQAACGGVLMPLATSVMLLVFPPERRGTAMGIYSLVGMLMPAIGPTVAGVLADVTGWHVLYLGMAVIGCVLAIVAFFSLENYGETSHPAFDVLSVVLSSLGLLGVLYGFSELGNGGVSAVSVVAVVAGVLFSAAFVVRQLKFDVPILELRVFAHRRFTVGLCILMGIQAIINANAVVLPLVIQTGMGQSATVTGFVTLPGALFGAVCALAAGRFFDRWGARPVALTGSLLMFASAAGFAFIGVGTPIAVIAILSAFSSGGLMLTSTPLNTWSLGFLPDEMIPHGNAVSNTMRQVASSIGTALIVSVMAIATASSGQADVALACFSGAHAAYLVQAVAALAIVVAVAVFTEAKGKAPAQTVTVKSEVENIMRTPAVAIPADATVRDAMALFEREHTTDAPLVDEQGRVVAFLSAGDIFKCLARTDTSAPDSATSFSLLIDTANFDERLETVRARKAMEIATPKVISIDRTDSLEHVCEVLSRKRIKKLPVVQEGRLVGSVNRADVVSFIMGRMAGERR